MIDARAISDRRLFNPLFLAVVGMIAGAWYKLQAVSWNVVGGVMTCVVFGFALLLPGMIAWRLCRYAWNNCDTHRGMIGFGLLISGLINLAGWMLMLSLYFAWLKNTHA